MALLHIDLDDTTVDLLARVVELNNADKTNKPVTLNDLDCWDRNGSFIDKYVRQEGFYFNLPIKKDAVSVLKELSERHQIKFLTAYPTALSAKEKVEFVEHYFPFIGVRNTTLTWSKSDIKGDLLFDDSPSFIPFFEGLKVVFDTPYNQHLASDSRVTSWEEFHTVIVEWERQGILLPTYNIVK